MEGVITKSGRAFYPNCLISVSSGTVLFVPVSLEVRWLIHRPIIINSPDCSGEPASLQSG